MTTYIQSKGDNTVRVGDNGDRLETRLSVGAGGKLQTDIASATCGGKPLDKETAQKLLGDVIKEESRRKIQPSTPLKEFDPGEYPNPLSNNCKALLKKGHGIGE